MALSPLSGATTSSTQQQNPVSAPKPQVRAPALDRVAQAGQSLEKGMRGPAVTELQQLLNQSGAQPLLAEDGQFGPKTDAAVRRFQAENGLKIDGVVGRETLAALQPGGGSVEEAARTQHRNQSVAITGHDAPPVKAPTAQELATSPRGTIKGQELTGGIISRSSNPTLAPAAAGTYGLPGSAKPLDVREFSGGGNIQAARDAQGHVGAVSFTAKMAIDSDGASNVTANHAEAKRDGKVYDPDYQSGTSMNWKGGKAVDANKVPYVVLPPDLAKASGAKLGDLVQVNYKGKNTFAIYADGGPKGKLGEGSMALARSLGMDDNPRHGGVDAQNVRYTVLPGSGKSAGISSGSAEASFEDIQRAGAAAFADAARKGLVTGG